MYNRTQSAQEARNTTIFFIQDGHVESDTLFNFVTESAEEVTSPRGIWTKLFVEEMLAMVDLPESHPDYAEGENEQGEAVKYGLFEWTGGHKKTLIQTYDTKEAAEDEWYTRIYNYDFMSDDQRDTMYYSSTEEAEKELSERVSF